MTDYEARVGDERVDPTPATWRIEWVDRAHGVARAFDGQRSRLVVAEGSGTEWTVTIGGRRVPVTVRSWRERVLAEAEVGAGAHAGPVEIRATLPGLVVGISVAAGDEVDAGASLLTIEAMKMQNEVRAPRPGRVIDVAVSAGQTVATGAALLRLE
jgi:biotin carboxyl carrier protein